MPGHGGPLGRALPLRLACGCLLLAATVRAEPTPVSPARERADLEAVCFVDRAGWAVGEHGAILHTADGGATWTFQESPVAERLLAVQFVDAARGWAVGGQFVPGFPASRGVVLRTDDGGQTWTCDRRQILPRLCGVYFADHERGWAWGEPSGVYPSGVLATSDGGRSFSPISWAPDDTPSRTGGWLAGTVPRPGLVALLGRDRSIVLLRNGRLRPFGTASSEATLHTLTAADEGALLVAGDDGAIVRLAPGEALEDPAADEAPQRPAVQWRTACAVENHIWLAGDPGSMLLHSPDAGATWESLPTGQTRPLTALAFRDPLQGCAVGPGGVILRTTDGGQAWQIARPGARVETLILALDPGSAPWEALDAAAEGAAVVWCAANRVAADPAGAADTRGLRLGDALSAVGARSAGVYGLPLWPSAARADGPRTMAVWNQLFESEIERKLAARIATLIDTWQPNVVCGPAPDNESAAGLVGRATAEAWRIAQSEPRPAGEALGLPPHRPRRWCIEVSDGKDRSPAGAETALARLLVSSDSTAQIAYQVRGGEGVGLTGPAALALAHRSDDPTAAQEALDLAKRLRHVQAAQTYAERNQPGGADLTAQLETLLNGLDDPRAASLLAQLAANPGREALAAARRLDERYPAHPLAALAAWRQWRAVNCAEEQLTSTPGPRNEQLQQAADANRGQIEQTGAALRIDDATRTRQAEAHRLLERLERLHPQLAFEPAARISLAAWHRREGRPDEARRTLHAAVSSRAADAWTQWMRAEAWLEAPRGACPIALATCRLDAPRPTLDGQLDDPTWQALAPLELSSPWGDDADFPAQAYLTADDEHLYLALRCQRAPDANYAAKPQARQRDADLSEFDRVRWRIDLDRDLADAFELTIDYRGWGVDRLTTDADWNPRWFIAAQLSDDEWTAEAAIPWSELRMARPATTDAWACRIERIVPGIGQQVWPPDERPSQTGPKSALVQFTAVGEASEPARLQPAPARPIPLPADGGVELPGSTDRQETP